MLLPIESHMIHNTVIPMIDNGTATRIDSACFMDGNEDEYRVEFWLLWGRVIRSSYNRRDTCSTYHFVADGWELDRLKTMAVPSYQI